MGTRYRTWAAAILAAIGLWFLAAPAQAQNTVYHFGVPPWQRGQSVDDIRRLYRPLLEYLSEVIGAPVDLVSARSYDDMIDYFVTGRVHFGTISPVPYVNARARNPGVRMLVTELSWNEDHSEMTDSYQGLFVTLKSRAGINTIDDLKGKNFAFVTEKSSSGFTYPAGILRDLGIDYQTFFGSYVFVGSHPRVTDAIVTGSVDAGATWDFNLKQAIEKHGNVFKIIHQAAIPNLGIAAHPSLPAEIQQKIKQALLTVPPALLDGLPTAGYVERPESFYDVVRAVSGLDKE